MALHNPKELEALETVGKEASERHDSTPPRKAQVPSGWKLGTHQAPWRPREAGQPSPGGLTGGWPGWCWVHSELGTVREVGHLSTAGRENTQMKSFLGRSRVCCAACLHLECCPCTGQPVRALCALHQSQKGPGKHPVSPSWVTGAISHIQRAPEARPS